MLLREEKYILRQKCYSRQKESPHNDNRLNSPGRGTNSNLYVANR